MASRMDRYNEEVLSKGRTGRNKDLYNSIYNDINYNNLDNIKNIAKPVSIDEIKNMLNKNKVEEVEPITSNIIQDEEKTYDINDVLSKAKTDTSDTKRRSIDISKYEYLNRNKDKTSEEEKEEVIQLINTISSNSMINKKLAVDLLEDLKSNTEIGKNNTEINKILKEVKQDTVEMDDSFFSKSLTHMDFEGVEKRYISKKLLIKRVLLIIGLLIIMIIIYFI